MAERLVADSATVQVMRVVSQREVNAAPLYREYYAPVYEFRLEGVDLLDGRDRPPLSFYGFQAGWIHERLPNWPRRPHDSLQWLTREGYAGLQETRFLDPADQGSVACAAVMEFEINAEFLVFRDARGALLAPAFSGLRGEAQRPVMMRIDGASDQWLEEVRRAIAANPQPPLSAWNYLFDAIFGRRASGDAEG